MVINKLFECFENYLPLNDSEKSDIATRFVERKIKKRQFILQQGDVCKHYTFVAEGCFRKYFLDDKGNEHNLQFAGENDWLMEIESFYKELPSKLYIEAMEPSIILQIKKPDLLSLFINNPKFDRNFRVIVETLFVELEERVLRNISVGAKQNYLSFLQRYGHLAQKLPNTHIASYLGITPEFLSKLRKDIVTKA